MLLHAVTQEFLNQRLGFGGDMCVSASAVLKEAVEELETGADVQLELCYVRRQIQRIEYDECVRHMLVKVEGQLYNPGTQIADAVSAAHGIPLPDSTEVVDRPPEGVRVLALADSVNLGEGQERGELILLDLLGSAPGRELWFNHADPELPAVRQARQQVLAFAQSLKGTVHSP